MAKDWLGGSAAVFKTLGASNHSRWQERGDVPQADVPRRQGAALAVPFYPTHSHLGKLVKTEMRQERRFQGIRQQCSRLRMVCVREGI